MANYITRADADTYFSNRLQADAWEDASDADKDKGLNMATLAIDRLNFLNEKASESQENQFPRGSDTTVPLDIQYACAEIAKALLDGVDPEIEYENLTMQSQGYANVRSTYDRTQPPEHIVAGIPSITAWRYLKPYLRNGKVFNMGRIS